MHKSDVDKCLEKGILTPEEYSKFMSRLSETEDGQLIGVSTNDHCRYNYELNSRILTDKDLIKYVTHDITPPLGAEYMDETFGIYGMTVSGICDGWHWFTKDNITDYAIQNGHKPIEEATETELWKMAAMADRYWHIQYERWYHHKEDHIRKVSVLSIPKEELIALIKKSQKEELYYSNIIKFYEKYGDKHMYDTENDCSVTITNEKRKEYLSNE